MPGPTGPSNDRLCHLDEYMSTGSLGMPVLQGTSRPMRKQRKALGLPQTNPPARYAWTRWTLKEEFWRRFQSFWADNAPQQYRDLSIGLDRRPHELFFPRATLGRLLAAWSGHGDFAQYHERFGHEDAKFECLCGRPKTPHHFYYCWEGHKASPQPWRSQQVDEILRSKSGTRDIHEWLL